jgi:hypothetical protein
MPFQNRVDPWGRIFRSAARGTLMGNRGGALHNQQQEIVRQYKGHRWIACVLEFKGRSRQVMTPGRYTELFFLDEAVAFAAGHRPCAECRRERFNAFVEAWRYRNTKRPGAITRAQEIDAELHRSRIGPGSGKITYQAALNSLPNGCFVEVGGGAYLVWDDALCLWSADRYVERAPRADHSVVTVLTPAPTVECFRAGYTPHVHESYRGGS